MNDVEAAVVLDGRASLVVSVLIVATGAAAIALLPAEEAATWLLLVVVGVGAGSVAGRPAAVWPALAALLVAEAGLGFAGRDPGGPFWPLLWAARMAVLFPTFVAGTAIGLPPRRLGRRWRVGVSAVAGACLVGLLGYVGYAVARSGDYLTQAGESDCRTPAVAEAWTYEPINYDPADDARLMAAHPDPTKCFVGNDARNGPDQGQKAGTEVVSSDGIRVAGWYIPAGNGNPPTAPTLVVVHGGKDNKSGMLKYAVPLHAAYNLVLLDLRNQGRSTGEVSSGGVLEARDLRAMIDWLERTKHPTWLGLVGNSNGAATVLAEAADDQRPKALVLDSMHASVLSQLGRIIETEQQPRLPAWPSAW
ncbi:MAG TPA: alpha/beta fold hydrolase, partial [Candidatus Limnocylindrales bacterium]|nr:alpha/beta fold hydrolase [Candidatus Limnocylindrales bacterium]